jgi:hypothetical protein
MTNFVIAELFVEFRLRFLGEFFGQLRQVRRQRAKQFLLQFRHHGELKVPIPIYLGPGDSAAVESG